MLYEARSQFIVQEKRLPAMLRDKLISKDVIIRSRDSSAENSGVVSDFES